MTPSPKLVSLVALAALAGASAAQAADADPTKAGRVVCTPERMARCRTADNCEWKNASARDKTRPLVIDFGAGKAFVRSGGKDRPYGDIVNDRTDGDARRFGIRLGTGGSRQVVLEMSLDRTGKLTGSRPPVLRIEAKCTAS